MQSTASLQRLWITFDDTSVMYESDPFTCLIRAKPMLTPGVKEEASKRERQVGEEEKKSTGTVR